MTAWGAALGVAAFWMLLIWVIHWTSPRTLTSFHGLIHAAVAGQFLDPVTATMPPENLFYAGRPLAYYWFFQFLGARVAYLFGCNVFYGMQAVILLSTGVLVVVAVGLGRVLYRSLLAGMLIGYLVMAGTNPLGFLFAAIRIARGGTRALRDDPHYLWGVVHPLYGLIRYNDIGGLYGPLLNFFLNMTSRPAALAALMAVVGCLRWALRRPEPLPWALLALTVAATTALSPVAGISAGGALLAGLTVSWTWTRRVCRTSTDDASARRFLAAGFCVFAGILAAVPTYHHLLVGPSHSQIRFWLFTAPGLKHLATVSLSVAPLGALAVVGTLRAPGAQRPFLVVLLAAALVLLAATAALVMPDGNHSNFFHAAVVLLSVPAAGSILRAVPEGERTVGSRFRAAGITLIFLPTVLLLLAAYVDRPPLLVSLAAQRPARLPQDSDLALLYRWAQRETGPDAVFVLDPSRRIAANGNVAEFPAMTGRAMFTEHVSHYLVAPYPDAGQRFEIAARLVSGDGLDRAGRDYLLALNRRLYIVSYQAEGDIRKRLQDLYGSPQLQAGDVLVFRWSG